MHVSSVCENAVRRVFIISFAAATLAACAQKPTPKVTALPSVVTVIARRGVVKPSEMLAGIVAPFANVAIQSTLTEPTDVVNVKEGDRVAKGEVLAVLDTADLRAQLDADLAMARSAAANTTHTTQSGSLAIAQGGQSVQGALAALRQARETLARDRIDLGRYRQLEHNGYMADQTFAQQVALVRNDAQGVASAQAALASAQAANVANGTLTSGGTGAGLQATSVEQAEATEDVDLAQARQIRTMIARATIVSPIDGVAVNRNLNVGEYPGARQIFTLQQTDPIYAILRGSGAQIAQIREGARSTVVASDLRDRRIDGTVSGILNEINPGSTDFVVKVVLRNGADDLRPGMAVRGRIALPALSGIEVPTTAFTDDSHANVMVVGPSGTVTTKAVVEAGNDGTTAVVSGLAAGARVVTDGQSGVGNGEKVALVK